MLYSLRGFRPLEYLAGRWLESSIVVISRFYGVVSIGECLGTDEVRFINSLKKV